MSPHQIKTWEESIALVYLKKAVALESYEATVSSPSTTLRVPAVVMLTKALSQSKNDVKFSRANVYTRDGYRCQYCGRKPPLKELNYDHVHPRSRGGATTWENIVTSCISCNLQKGNKTLKQTGMKLRKQPVRPRSLPMSSSPILLPVRVPELWVPYLSDRLASIQVVA
jgi:5-methylcytosine-specific restriction endonuclease McrA